MAKRKFGASIIILCIATITLVSGTYAWFLVGGFAELFDIGFDIIEATGGVLLRGDAGTHDGGQKTAEDNGFGSKLERSDFLEYSFIHTDSDASKSGRYRPVSTMDGVNFISVEMDNSTKEFKCTGVVPSKRTATTPTDICYNDFTFAIKSSAEEIPAGAYTEILLSGFAYDDAGNKIDDGLGAAKAARVSITVDGTTTIYSYDAEGYQAVTTEFADNTIFDNATTPNYIIDSTDVGYAAAGLQTVTDQKLMESFVDGEGKTQWRAIKIYLGALPGKDANGGNGKDVTIRIWLEGNDKDCIAFGDGAIAGKGLSAHLNFGVDQ